MKKDDELNQQSDPASTIDAAKEELAEEITEKDPQHPCSSKINKHMNNVCKKMKINNFVNIMLMLFGVNLTIGALCVVILSSFKSEIELFLFPAVSRIPLIKNELERVHLLHEERGKQLTDLSVKMTNEIATLKESMHALSEEINVLKKQFETKTKPAMESVLPTEFGLLWNGILARVQKGESFEKELHALNPYVSTNKDVLLAIHPLVDCAAKETRTFDALLKELLLLKEELVHSNTLTDIDNSVWWQGVWHKFKRLIRLENMDGTIVTINDPLKKTALLRSIEAAIQFMEQQHYDKAIQEIRMHALEGKSALTGWLADAEARLSLQQKIENLQRHLVQLLAKRVD